MSGWFVINAREAQWIDSGGLGIYCAFEGEERFPELGVNISVLRPGEPNCMYHGEAAQEDFLVLAGECLLIVQGEERTLRAWDFFHCPPWTEHVFVGAGDGPCLLLAVGSRSSDGVRYTANDVAARHGAAVERETEKPAEAYAGRPEPKPAPPPEGFF